MILSTFILSTKLDRVMEPALSDLVIRYVEGGSFTMGGEGEAPNENEVPLHFVKLDDFGVSDSLITQSQWMYIMGYNPSFWKGDQLPVENVSYYEVLEFIERLNAKTGKHYRLLTEAEWEFSARGGNFSKGFEYAGASSPDEIGWYSQNGDMHTHPVRTKHPNELGLYDMTGNLWEWVSDWYCRTYYSESPKDNPQGPLQGTHKVLRGGRFGSPLNRCRNASRCFSEMDRKCNAHGFRLALPVQEIERNLVFSSATASYVTLSDSNYESLLKGDFCSINKCTYDQLVEAKILVNSHDEELHSYYAERAKRLDKLGNTVAILTTTRCNAHCFYCFEKGIDNHLSLSGHNIDATIQFINDYYTNKNLNIYWFGGEPLYNFEAIEQVTKGLLACGFTLSTHVVTNLSLLDENKLKFFKDNYKGHISFEIPIDDIGDGYNAIKKYSDRDPNRGYNDVMQNVRLLLDNKIFVSISINYVASRFAEKVNCYLHLKKILSEYPKDMYYLFLTPLYLHGKSELITEFNSPISSHPYLQTVKLRLENENEKTLPFILNTLALLPKKPCEIDASKVMLTINSNGDIYNCIRLVGRDGYQIGNVVGGITRKQAILEKQFSIHDPKRICENCSILPICQGGCVSKIILCGNGHECHKIKQVQSPLLKIFYDELISLKTSRG